MLVAVPLTVSLVSFRLWGRLIDRLGYRPSLLIAGLLIVPGAAGWIFVSRESWWLGYMVVMISVVAWPGVELANFNILLGMSESQQGHRQGGAFIAVNSVVVAAAGVISGLFGGFLARHLGDWEAPFFGRTLTYHGVLFLISAALRLASLLWVLGLEEPKGCTTREAVRYLVANMYSNIQQAVFMPLRRLGRLGKLAYRLGRGRASGQDRFP
jgi:MFS family permease